MEKPFYALAPLAGITDSAFRQMGKRFGADVVYSEMVSATALFYNDKKTFELMRFNEVERPYVVQLFGAAPEHFAAAAKIITSPQRSPHKREGGILKPDGIDINFGCPVPKVVKQGAGIALFEDLKRAREVIRAVIGSTDLPVSIKTRSRVGETDILKFLGFMQDLDIKAVMIHGRSAKQGFSGPVDFRIIKDAKKYFDGTIIANGGVGVLPPPRPLLRKEGEQASGVKAYSDWLLDETQADGVAIGQGAMGRPWIFQKIADRGSQSQPSPGMVWQPSNRNSDRCNSNISILPPSRGEGTWADRQFIFRTALEHAELAEKLKGKQGIIEMRKHLCWYVQGLPGAKDMRRELVQVEKIADIKRILKE